MVFVKTHVVNSGSNSFGMMYPRKGEIDRLLITHNAGFFSCCTIALQDIVIWHREHRGLPEQIDRSMQYAHYKHTPLQNLIPFYFNEQETPIPYNDYYEISHDTRELQFSNYKKIDFEAAKPFIDKFFTPSQHVLDIVKTYEDKYQIDYEYTIGVFYRGNDKNRETNIAGYEDFLRKCADVELSVIDDYMPDYFVLPDEIGFLNAMQEHSERTITPDELPTCQNKDSAMFLELPLEERAEYGAKFLAAVIVMSKCKHLITHSGNCGLWAVLYRGNADNVHQWQNDKWI